MKHFYALILLLAGLGGLGAQTHNPVPVTEEYLYDFLEMAEIRGLTDPLPGARPYSLSRIGKALEDIRGNRRQLSSAELDILDMLIEDFVENPDRPFSEDGDVRIDNENFPAEAGAYLSGTIGTNLNNGADGILGEAVVGGYLRGDAGPYVSWGVNMTAGAFLTDDYDPVFSYGPVSAEPYRYTKNWDGGVHPANSLSKYRQMPTSLSFGTSFEPDVSASFMDNRLEFRMGRMRNDWGLGEGNLFLNAQARPFMGFGGIIDPWDWITVSYISGIMEFGENFRNADDYGLRNTSREQQNMFALLQLEFRPAERFYVSFFDSAIYLKRPEWGYTFPLMSQFLSQNNTGDFDNLAMGATLAYTQPGLFRTYMSFYLDEARFNHDDFWGNPDNMYSYQAGIKIPVPKMPWSLITFQYTKIEPFTYTHYYLTEAPGYTPPDSDNDGNPDYAMDTGYLNGGENLGYNLEPNSDELMLQIKSQIRPGINWLFRYRMVRHGYAGSGGPPGSTFDAWGFDPADPTVTPSDDPNGAYGATERKDFLKDGVYEWFHIFTLGGELDTRIWNEPVRFSVTYSYTHMYYTDHENTGNMKALDSGIFANNNRNVISVTASVSPW